MSRMILDTSYLIAFWKRKLQSSAAPSLANARAWAIELCELQGTNAIVSPVYVEFVCGARTSGETRLFESFLSAFRLLDAWEIRRSDWDEALRIARRVPQNGRPRQAIDCLVRAMANRLGCTVLTLDVGFPRR